MEAMNCEQLRHICRTHGYKGFSRLTRAQLIAHINLHSHVEVVDLTQQEQSEQKVPTASSIKKNMIEQSGQKAAEFIHNTEDQEYKGPRCVISTDPIDPKHSFQHLSSQYNIHSLHDYIVSSGDTRDPVSRQPYTDEELIEIDRLYSEYIGQTNTDAVDVKKKSSVYDKQKDRENTLTTYASELDRITSDMIQLIETRQYSHFIMNIKLDEYKQFFLIFRDENKERALMAITHNIEMMNNLREQSASAYTDRQLEWIGFIWNELYMFKLDYS